MACFHLLSRLVKMFWRERAWRILRRVRFDSSFLGSSSRSCIICSSVLKLLSHDFSITMCSNCEEILRSFLSWLEAEVEEEELRHSHQLLTIWLFFSCLLLLCLVLKVSSEQSWFESHSEQYLYRYLQLFFWENEFLQKSWRYLWWRCEYDRFSVSCSHFHHWELQWFPEPFYFYLSSHWFLLYFMLLHFWVMQLNCCLLCSIFEVWERLIQQTCFFFFLPRIVSWVTLILFRLSCFFFPFHSSNLRILCVFWLILDFHFCICPYHFFLFGIYLWVICFIFAFVEFFCLHTNFRPLLFFFLFTTIASIFIFSQLIVHSSLELQCIFHS